MGSVCTLNFFPLACDLHRSQAIAELESAITALHTEDPSKRKSSLKSKLDKEKSTNHREAGSVFSKFKKCRFQCDQTRSNAEPFVALTAGPHVTQEDGTLIRHSPDTSVNIHVQRAHIALESLKSQHAALLRSLYAVQNDSLPPTMRGSPLPKTTDEKTDELLSVTGFPASLSRQSNRISSMTDLSDSVPVEWFDAEDNFGEEFLLEDPTPEEEKAQPVLQSRNSSLNGYGSASSDEEDHSIPLKTNDDFSLHPRQVVRRTHLPSGPVGDEGSLFAMLKKNVGKVCFGYLTS